MKNRHFLQSLGHALDGMGEAFLTERNFRFHTAAANLICIFAYFYGISRLEWGLLILTIAMVMTAELINTAVEGAVDTATEEYRETARAAKDTAAAAVLLAAFFAVVMGFVLFFDPERIKNTLIRIFSEPAILLPCIAVGIIDVGMVLWKGKNKDKTERNI